MKLSSGRAKTQRHYSHFWWKLSLPLPVSKRLQEMLWKHESTGFNDDGQSLHAYFDGNSQGFKALLVWLNRDPAFRDKIVISRVPAEDWESGWKKHFKPIAVTKRFIVKPSWEPYRKKKGEHVIVIDPKMSFGTGTHETTQIMMRLMETVQFRNMTVLDAGTGTGILAIAAAHLKAETIFGVDVESESIDNARENIRKNNVQCPIRLKLTSFSELPARWPKKYDIILANIQSSVLAPQLAFLAGKLNKAGIMILSGIMKEEDGFFRGELASNKWKLIRKINKKEWMGYLVKHQGQSEI